MLTNPQKSLIKRAQRDCALSDVEYRDVLDTCTNCRSSKDPRLDDTAFDTIMKYLEAIYWRKIDQSAIADRLSAIGLASPARTSRSFASIRGSKIFSRRNYWANKNTRKSTSRDRYQIDRLQEECETLRDEAARYKPPNYLATIANKCCPLYPPTLDMLCAWRNALRGVIAREKSKLSGAISSGSSRGQSSVASARRTDHQTHTFDPANAPF